MREPPDKIERRGDLWGRRDILTAAGWTAVVASLVAATVAFVRLLFRRAPIEPPAVFSAGHPGDYVDGQVSERFLKSWRVYIVREEGVLFAIHARCTHLGCTPRWRTQETKFKCPCHGSGFTAMGVNFEGPAPRPLERAKIWADRRGGLWVDTSKRFTYAERDEPGAAVAVAAQGQEGA